MGRALRSDSAEPSDRLKPSTPSLPWAHYSPDARTAHSVTPDPRPFLRRRPRNTTPARAQVYKSLTEAAAPQAVDAAHSALRFRRGAVSRGLASSPTAAVPRCRTARPSSRSYVILLRAPRAACRCEHIPHRSSRLWYLTRGGRRLRPAPSPSSRDREPLPRPPVSGLALASSVGLAPASLGARSPTVDGSRPAPPGVWFIDSSLSAELTMAGSLRSRAPSLGPPPDLRDTSAGTIAPDLAPPAICPYTAPVSQ